MRNLTVFQIIVGVTMEKVQLDQTLKSIQVHALSTTHNTAFLATPVTDWTKNTTFAQLINVYASPMQLYLLETNPKVSEL
jgi:hypothetical protein